MQREEFLAVHDTLLARWPRPIQDVDLTSEFGSTRVHVSGAADAPSVVLFHAYQATSAEWFELARMLGGERRIYAVDMMGDAGHSVPATARSSRRRTWSPGLTPCWTGWASSNRSWSAIPTVPGSR